MISYDMYKFIVLILVLFISAFLGILILKYRYKLISRGFKKALLSSGFYYYKYKPPTNKGLFHTIFKASEAEKRSRKMKSIEARTLKNKSLFITQEKMNAEDIFYDTIFTFQNRKLNFPSFRLERIKHDYIKKVKEISDFKFDNHFSVLSENPRLLMSKLNKIHMKINFKPIIKGVYKIEYSIELNTITIYCFGKHLKFKQIIKFLLILDEELEDYYPGNGKIINEILTEIEKKEEDHLRGLKYYNIINLVDIKSLKLKCSICWGKIDYSIETIMFECCAAYTHKNHGKAWLEKKDKCPRCNQETPYIIQLPKIERLGS